MTDLSLDNWPDTIGDDCLTDELRQQLLALVGDRQTGNDRRIRERFPLCGKMFLTPIDGNANWKTTEATTIFAKDLSRRGISFSHDRPIAHRRVVISIQHMEFGQFNVEAEVTWSRQTSLGLYESGCRIIRKIS